MRGLRTSAILALAVAACTTFGEAPADRQDGAAPPGGDAGADAARDAATDSPPIGEKCAQRHVCPGATLAADDLSALPTGTTWVRGATDGTLDTADYVSAPAALRADIAAGGGSTGASYIHTAPVIDGKVVCLAACMKLERSGSFGAADNDHVDLFRINRSRSGLQSDLLVGLASKDYVYTGSLAPLDTPLPTGRWFHLALELDVETNVYSLYVNDARRAQGNAVIGGSGPLAVKFEYGAVPSGNTSALTARFDDVRASHMK